jgi:hypothetical protein
MTSVYVSGVAADNAVKVQETHRADADGCCGFCLRHFLIRVKAGQCAPWRRAQAFIDICIRQQERFTRSPKAGSLSPDEGGTPPPQGPPGWFG